MLGKLFGKAKTSEPTPPSPSRTVINDQISSTTSDLARETIAHALRSNAIDDGGSEKLFYNFLFSDSGQAKEPNALEEDILLRVNALLDDPKASLDRFPPLPKSIAKLVDVLGKDDFVLMEFLDIVKEEPPVASAIIKVANSATYNQSGKPIVDLTKAFMSIGAAGVKETVLMAFVRQFSQIKTIYFKAFGDKIWQHSQHTANLTKQLAEKKQADKEAGFFIGLVHDMGKIVIFRIMVDAFKVADPEHTPGSVVFKKMLSEKSMQLSLELAQHWKMPTNISNAIYDLLNLGKEPPATALGEALAEANLISELWLMHQAKRLGEEELQAIIESAEMSDEAIDLLHQTIQSEAQELN